ncbi:MAG: transcription antitermination factor NusB [Lentimicrobiaceae bacterium]|jgi:N utilization substance protein B|nr:transcription antitermination factor NusB [Lentimicrobiaceae bacterium]MCP4910685.1 transcription antitermination factor NusB [Bacteroidota bacterium]MBT3454585.1 transcription antitermination factor NusB [Lentimicrobiaceae bacterium]MBT3818283.1 transcription antitermination factor NusB [Lentimicrobiaceae bacterium]MBT4062236.1 transcription antitermination factor NusB [Lentimicrobiaceae bacterium]
MLYRRHLRIKVLQSLYSWYTGGTSDIIEGEKQLLESIDKLHDLFLFQLSFLVEIKRFAEIRIEENKHKFYPKEEDLNPNTKFINNKVLIGIENNNEFILNENRLKVNWTDQSDMIMKFYNLVREKEFFKKYMASEDNSIEADKKVIIKIIDQCLPDYDLLKAFYEEKSVYFTDGYDLVILLLIKFIENFNSKFSSESSLPGIYKPTLKGKNEDREFVRVLYKTVLRNDSDIDEELKHRTKNWEFERIPVMDIILLKMAIIELQKMETVPVKVTLNEYIELAKYFSTNNSKVFVNGVLDRLIKEYNQEGRINKSGRGLQN